MSKIPNWHELTDAERVKTIRLIAKRNAARKAALLAEQAEAEAKAIAQGGDSKQHNTEKEKEGEKSKSSVESQDDTAEVLLLEN